MTVNEFLDHECTPPPEPPALPLGLYRHYRGGLYRVTETCTHTETMEIMVRYQGKTGKWVRPLGMFLEKVETEAGVVPRFRLEKELPSTRASAPSANER